MKIVFLVGTGRNGSTVFAEILRAHPDVLSLSELWAMVGRDMIDITPVSGARFWKRLATPNPGFTAMMRGSTVPEFLYVRKPGRFRPEEGVPPLCLVTLPHLSDDPDAMFDELGAVMPTWPDRPIADHWRALFRLLGPDRSHVVERSGYSLVAVPRLRVAFPEARFVHLYRDGPDCAVSMSRHPAFRMILLQDRMRKALGLASIDGMRPEHIHSLPPDLSALLGRDFDARRMVMERELPVAEFGEMWSETIEQGMAELAGLPECLHLRFEDVLECPERELSRFFEYMDAPVPPDWIRAAAERFDPTRRGSAHRLTPAEREALTAACAPGMRCRVWA